MFKKNTKYGVLFLYGADIFLLLYCALCLSQTLCLPNMSFNLQTEPMKMPLKSINEMLYTRQCSFKVCNRLLFVQLATCNLAKTLFLKFDFLLAVYTWHCLETWILGGEDQSGYLEKFGILEAIFNTFIFTLGSIGFFGCSFNICCEFKREKILFWTCYTEALRRWLYGRTEFVSTLAVPSDSLFTFGTGQRMKITDGEEKMSSCFLFEMWKTKAWTDLTHLVCFCF